MSDCKKVYSEPHDTYYPLDMHVLAVAVAGDIGDWAAYVDAVEGENHDIEWQEVAKKGSKLSRKIASAIFPQFDPDRYRG